AATMVLVSGCTEVLWGRAMTRGIGGPPNSNVPQNKSTQETPKDGRVGVVRTHARHGSRAGLTTLNVENAGGERPLPLTTRQTPLLNDLVESLFNLNAKPDVILTKASELYHSAKDRSLIKDALAEEVRKFPPNKQLIAGDKVKKLEALDLRIYYFL